MKAMRGNLRPISFFLFTLLVFALFPISQVSATVQASAESRPPFTPEEWVKENTPVFGPSGSGFDAYAAYNPAVVYHNGRFYMFYRAQASPGGISYIGMATSEDGLSWQRRSTPAISPTESYESRGCEDPRVVKIDNVFWMTYTAYDGSTARQALARSTDLENWEKVGVVFQTWSKSGAIVPEKINGRYWMYLETDPGGGDLYYATSTDLLHWTMGGVVLRRRAGYFDSLTIEPGPPPVVLDHGILLIYNSLDAPLGSGGALRSGWVIFSKDDPTKIVARCERPFLQPELTWERSGQVPDCVFSEGLVRVENMWYLYYGAADMHIGLARAPVRERTAILSVDTYDEWAAGYLSGSAVLRQYGGIRLLGLDPVGWWKFDDGSGLTATDSGSGGNSGTVINASWTSGKVGGALDFVRASESRVEVGDVLEGFSGLSIVAWIYPRSKPHNGEIVKKDLVYLLRVNESQLGTTAFMVWDSSGTKYTLEVPDDSFPNNSWSMIAATWDGSMMRIYRDNAVKLGERNASFGRLNSSPNALTIGNQPGGGEGFEGLIDEVMIFSRALSEEEIAMIYSGVPAGTSGGWSSGWMDLGEARTVGEVEVEASLLPGENVRVAVLTSSDGQSVRENTGWRPVSNGVTKIPLSLAPARFVRVDLTLSTESSAYSPTVYRFALYGEPTVAPDNTPPASFSLLGPENGSEPSQSPLLEWQASSDESGILHYEVWVNGVNIENVTSTSYQTSLENGCYEWWVVAVDMFGNRRESTGRHVFYLGGRPSFSLSVSPVSAQISPGQQTQFSISVVHTAGIMVAVSLSASGLPPGATATFSPASGTPPFSSVLTISTAAASPPGTYRIAVSASGGGVTLTENITLELGRPAVFSVENLRLSKERVKVGEKVVARVDVSNVGGEPGQYVLILKVDNLAVENRVVHLSTGDSLSVSFDLSFDRAGTFRISVDNLVAEVDVLGEGLPVIPIVGVFAAFACLIVIIRWFFFR